MQKINRLILVLGVVLLLSACNGNQQQIETGKDDAKTGNETIGNSEYISNMLKSNQNSQSNKKTEIESENKQASEASKVAAENKLISNKDELTYMKKYTAAIIETSMGEIKVKFYADAAPVTVNNFLKLASEKFYDNTKFHRVIKGFMIQGGDPNSKMGDISTWGQGGPGYKFDDELKGTEKYPQGTLAMANSGPNTNGSQFFIVTADPAAPLPPKYTVFGQVVSGMDVALKIENVETVLPGRADRPAENVVIKSIKPIE